MATTHKEIKQLKERLKALKERLEIAKNLPEDFRKLYYGSIAWEVYYELHPEKRAEMDAWVKGPVLVAGKLCHRESWLLGRPTVMYPKMFSASDHTWDDIWQLVCYALASGYTLIYVRDIPEEVARAWNTLLTRYGMNTRIQVPFKDSKGVPIKWRDDEE